MKRTLLLIGFLCVGLTAAGQDHGMKYYYEEEYECWTLEEATNRYTHVPVVKPDGTPGNPRTALAQCLTGKQDLDIVYYFLEPLLPRYEAQGLKKFVITYIIDPAGFVFEVTFGFCDFDGKLDITEEDMKVWRRISDEIKLRERYTIPPQVQKLKFYRMGRIVVIDHLKKMFCP